MSLITDKQVLAALRKVSLAIAIQVILLPSGCYAPLLIHNWKKLEQVYIKASVTPTDPVSKILAHIVQVPLSPLAWARRRKEGFAGNTYALAESAY